MKLLFKDTVLAHITQLGVDGFEYCGEITRTEHYDEFRDFFRYITDGEDNGIEKKKNSRKIITTITTDLSNKKGK